MSNPWTPGPWRAFYDKSMAEWHVKAGGWPLFPNGIDSGNPEADVRLIASAPALVDALEKTMRVLEKAMASALGNIPKSDFDDMQIAYAEARAALSLAKGTQGETK